MTLDGAGAALFGADLREPAPQITGALTTSAGRLPARHGPRWSHAAPLPAARRRSGALSQGRARQRRRRPHPRALGGDAAPGPVLDLLTAQPELTDEQVRDRGDDVAAGRARDDGDGPHLGPGRDRPERRRCAPISRSSGTPNRRLRSGELAGPAAADHGRPGRDVAPVAAVVDVQPPGPRAGAARWAHRAGGTMCLVSPALAASRPALVGRARTVPARPLAAAPSRGDRPLRPQGPGQPRGAYLPFGAGPRMCIGEQFAWSEAATMLAELGRTWRVRVHRRSADRRPVLDDVAAGRSGAGHGVAAKVMIPAGKVAAKRALTDGATASGDRAPTVSWRLGRRKVSS